MTSNTHTLATALCLIADSLEESEDSDLIKTTVVVAAERLEKLEQDRDQLTAQIGQLKALWLEASKDVRRLFEVQPRNRQDGSYEVDGQSVYELEKAFVAIVEAAERLEQK